MRCFTTEQNNKSCSKLTKIVEILEVWYINEAWTDITIWNVASNNVWCVSPQVALSVDGCLRDKDSYCVCYFVLQPIPVPWIKVLCVEYKKYAKHSNIKTEDKCLQLLFTQEFTL